MSALAIDSAGLADLRKPAAATAKLEFALDRLALPKNAKVTNLAVLLPGVDGGAFNAALGASPGAPATLSIKKGNNSARLAQARDVVLWIEYDVT